MRGVAYLRRALLAAASVVLCASLLAACGGDSRRDESSSSSRDDAGALAVQLTIRADDGRGTVEEATLECGENTARAPGLPGRDPAELCRLARRLRPTLTREPDPRRACTQLYGGPETARVRGSIEGSQVDRRFSRVNGCEIADWDEVAPLLPLEAAGADAPPRG